MDGKITDTIADTQVELGFILEKDGEMQELPGIQTKIPASERVEADGERATVESDKKLNRTRQAKCGNTLLQRPYQRALPRWSGCRRAQQV